MISDNNKKITGIIYNILNLLSQITIAGNWIIKYFYDVAGNKLQKWIRGNTVSTGKNIVITYIGGAVCLNATIQFFDTEEGGVRTNDAWTAWIYEYFLEDYLGNTLMMITYDYNVSSPMLEANSYYPIGLQHKWIRLSANNPLHNFKNTFQKQ